MCLSVTLSLSLSLSLSLCVCVFVYMHVCVCVCVCIYTYICIYIHIHIYVRDTWASDSHESFSHWVQRPRVRGREKKLPRSGRATEGICGEARTLQIAKPSTRRRAWPMQRWRHGSRRHGSTRKRSPSRHRP
jgi:hypothetical protein